MTMDKLLADLSASFFRQQFFIRLCRIENECFSQQIGANPVLKNVNRLMKNEIGSIDLFHKEVLRLLPKSHEKIERTIDHDKILVISSIVEKLSYMTIEQLEEVDDQIVMKKA